MVVVVVVDVVLAVDDDDDDVFAFVFFSCFVVGHGLCCMFFKQTNKSADV